jgi:hypothetical protein
MINRATMRVANALTSEFKVDNKRMWEILRQLMSNLSCWTQVKVGQQGYDGRKAFFALYNLYLGPQHASLMATKAEDALKDSVYYKETKRFDFDSFVCKHQDAHHISANHPRGHHNGMNEEQKVRMLLNGIKAPHLEHVISIIHGHQQYLNNFDACVAYIKTMINRGTSRNAVQVAAVQSSNRQGTGAGGSASGGAGGGTSGGSGQVAVRYYTDAEYSKLSHAQKKKLKEMRSNRDVPGYYAATGKNSNGKRSSGKASGGRNSKEHKKNPTANVSTVTFHDEPSADEDDSSDEQTVTTGNRNNPNLTRQQAPQHR